MISPNFISSAVGIGVNFSNAGGAASRFLPQRIAVIGHGTNAASYSLDKRRFFKASDVGAAYGFGSPLHQVARILIPDIGIGVESIPVTFYPVAKITGQPVSTATITLSGTPSLGEIKVSSGSDFVRIRNALSETPAQAAIKVSAAINANNNFPFTAASAAAVITLTSKFICSAANEIPFEVISSSFLAATASFYDLSSGTLQSSDIDSALQKFGESWETLVVNAGAFSTENYNSEFSNIDRFNQLRWSSEVHKPFVLISGRGEYGFDPGFKTQITEIAAQLKNQRTSSIIYQEGSLTPPWAIAASAALNIAKTAEINPPKGYSRQILTGVLPGPDELQKTSAEREALVQAGVSTTTAKDGQVFMADTRTTYHPDNNVVREYSHVVDLMKIFNVIYNLDLIFNRSDWIDVPLVPDNQQVTNREAKSPSTAVAEIASMIDSLALEAIISDPVNAKKSIRASISSVNPKRLDVSFFSAVSGNTLQADINYSFGFLYGG